MDTVEIQKRASDSLAGVTGGMSFLLHLVRANSDPLQNQQRILTA